MTSLDVTGRRTGELLPPRRNNYFYSKLLDVPHLEMEQRYGQELRHLLNRLSLGTGVLCGLGVEGRDGQVCVLPGVAVDGRGREIVVPERFCLDPWRLTDGCGGIESELPRDAEHTVTVCLAYHECLTDYAPVLVTDCAIKESAAAGTVVETFRVEVRRGAPEVHPGRLSAEVCAALFGPDASAGRGEYEVVATIPVGGEPSGIAVTADGRRAVVLSVLSGSPRLQVLDVAADSVTDELGDDRLALPFGGVSVAPEGGPALATHAGGVAVVDLAADPPAIRDNLLGGTAYGVCAAAFGGQVLFALNVSTGQIDRIDITAGTVVATIDAGPGVMDLAVSSPDSRWLYAAVAPGAPLARIDTNSNQVANPPSAAAQPARTLAVRATPSGPEAWLASPGLLRVVGEVAVSDHDLAVDPRDSAFTDDGDRYYVLDAAGSGTPELAVFEAAGPTALARVPLGARPAGLAVVPGRSRALVTNAGAGTVSVVDLGPMDRYRLLCELLAGACPAPATDVCVPLAVVRLRPGGKVGPVQVCAHRPLLLSNTALLDLILCLAARVDDCCRRQITIAPAALPSGHVGVAYPGATVVASGGTAPYALQVIGGALPPGLGVQRAGADSLEVGGIPTQAGTFAFVVHAQDTQGVTASRGYTIQIDPSERPPETLRVRAVLFLGQGAQGLEPLDEFQPDRTHRFRVDLLRGIRVVFTGDVDIATVTTAAARTDPADRCSFLVVRNRQVLPGRIVQESPDSATFLPADEVEGRFPRGSYLVTLYGDDGPERTAIRADAALQATRLDGEGPSTGYPPSGDGSEGGNFEFRFTTS